MGKIELHFKEDGYCLKLGEQVSETVGYGETVEFVVDTYNGVSLSPSWRYLAFADVGEPGDTDGVGVSLDGVTFSPTDYWVYRVTPVEDDGIEFIDEDEAETVPAAIVGEVKPEVITEVEKEKVKENENVEDVK